MLGFLSPLLGGIGGLLFPAAGAAAAGGAAATGIGALLAKAALPALGAGLGTLAAGGGGKDAIRNALLMGVGVTALPGVAAGIQNSEFGKSITGGLANLFGPGDKATSTIQQVANAVLSPEPGPTGIPSALPSNPPPRRTDDMGPRIPPEAAPLPEPVVRIPPPTTLPSLTDMAAIGDRRREERLGEDFELFRRIGPPELGRIGMPGSQRFAMGGEISGPGTGTSDSIPAEIYQDGKPVKKAALSDGEFVMTAKAVKGAGNGSRERGISRMYELMRRFEGGEMA